MKLHQYSILLLLIVFTFISKGYTQETISPSLQLQYFKNSDEQRLLKATLSYTFNRKDIPLRNREILFFIGSKKDTLGKVSTNDKGVANLILSNDYKLSLEKDGTWFFTSEFFAKDSIEAVSAEISIKDVKIEMSLDLVDSVKTVTLKAYTIENGKNIPITGEPINVFVTRMFSLLPVADGIFGDDGTLSLEFPSDIPGDKDGNIIIVAKFEEHATFGNVEKRYSNNWGVVSNYKAPTTHRALWTKGAPTWMIIALTIMLTGVWGHYMYAIICLIRIKKSDDKEEQNLL
ncbi:MAG: hypothetical protein HOO91_15675 [Bacteroidales bacterium]|nr:hypothetical protein [Bacteroidales bacterium]